MKNLVLSRASKDHTQQTYSSKKLEIVSFMQVSYHFPFMFHPKYELSFWFVLHDACTRGWGLYPTAQKLDPYFYTLGLSRWLHYFNNSTNCQWNELIMFWRRSPESSILILLKTLLGSLHNSLWYTILHRCKYDLICETIIYDRAWILSILYIVLFISSILETEGEFWW